MPPSETLIDDQGGEDSDHILVTFIEIWSLWYASTFATYRLYRRYWFTG